MVSPLPQCRRTLGFFDPLIHYLLLSEVKELQIWIVYPIAAVRSRGCAPHFVLKGMDSVRFHQHISEAAVTALPYAIHQYSKEYSSHGRGLRDQNGFRAEQLVGSGERTFIVCSETH